MTTMDDYRQDFERTSNRSVSMPIAGAIVWAAVAVISTQVDPSFSVYILLFASGAIFPIALGIAAIRKENLVSSDNPFARLMGLCVLMVNLLWAVHVPLLFRVPEFVPLSLGIGLGLHWIVYSWIVRHPVGIIHSVSRTVLIVGVWYLFPGSRLLAISVAVVLVYVVSITVMLRREVRLPAV